MVVFPEVTAGPDLSVSASLFVAYAQCPDQALARLRGEYPAESRVAFRGSLAHRMFARHLTRGPVDPESFEQACREEIGTALNPKVASLHLRPSELAGVIREVGDMYATFRRLPTDGFRDAEVFIELEPAPGVVLKGSIDAVFDGPGGTVRLVDWKTGGLGVAERQLAFYSMLWALEKGALPTLAEAVSVTTGERTAARPTDESVTATAHEVAALVDAVRAVLDDEAWIERAGGSWCRWCPLLDRCPDGASAASILNAG